MKQPLHTQCSLKCKKLHVSAVLQNCHHQALQLRNIKVNHTAEAVHSTVKALWLRYWPCM